MELLTAELRRRGHEVRSFVENNHGEGHGAEKPVPFEEWVKTEAAQRSFEYDTNGATTSDLVIYLGPAGVDAWAEIGAAFAASRQPLILGLYAKGEQVGLMRKMVFWHSDFRSLLAHVDSVFSHKKEVS